MNISSRKIRNSSRCWRPLSWVGVATAFVVAVIQGYHAGKLAFIEPMLAQSALIKRKPYAGRCSLPAAAAAVLPWPTRHTTSHDPEVDGYQIVLSGFVHDDEEIDASDSWRLGRWRGTSG